MDRLSEGSSFIFGPRQAGKSTFLRGAYPGALYLDLLNSQNFRELGSEPSALMERLRAHLVRPETKPIVIIDEIQKLPPLLDAVHEAMSAHPQVQFLLTGSSPRKLRRAGSNLLGGRAAWLSFHPLTTSEVKTWPEKGHTWHDLLQKGGLPAVLKSANFKKALKSYVDLYLKEEIAEEALVRNLPQFSRFLHIAGQTSGQQIIFEKIASDCEMKGKTVRSWYEILEETLLGSLLPPFGGARRRKTVSAAKFYLFDLGVANYLNGIFAIEEGTPAWGNAFEHLVFTELKAACDYQESPLSLSFWRTTSGVEVDFVLHNDSQDAVVAIEVKGKTSPTDRDFQGLRALAEECPNVTKIVVARCASERLTEDGIRVLPAETFFSRLWQGEILPG